LAKNKDLRLLTSLKNRLSLEQVILARCSIQIIRPDFHLSGWPVLVGFRQIHVSTVCWFFSVFSSEYVTLCGN